MISYKLSIYMRTLDEVGVETSVIYRAEISDGTLLEHSFPAGTMAAVDTSGNTRKLISPQAGTTQLASGVSEVSVEFTQEFPQADKPMVTLQPTTPIGNTKTKLSQNGTTKAWTGFEVAVQNAPTASTELVWAATPKNKK